jgi:nonsense-mediated mRNA decay protein 3
MCPDCISLSVDVTAGIQKNATLTFCKNCERLLVPPNHWIFAARESRELLGACLKRLKGLSKVRLVDAKYVWTEPHSRRTKIKVTVQAEAEAFQNTVVQQEFVVEFVETTAQCPDCAKSFTANTWRATIQVRQKVDHKRTFFFLEQIILKHKAQRQTVSIQEARDGLDFFFSQRQHAIKMVDFLTSVVPARVKKSEELISADTHTGAKNFKFTYVVEVVPVCKDDLVVLPKKLARSMGSISQLVLCSGIGNTIHFMDPVTLQTAGMTAATYWRSPFVPLASGNKGLTEYVVLDIEPTGENIGKHALADATVARSSDLGSNDQTFYVRTHLGGILHPGDTALGYHLANSNYNHDLWDGLDKDRVPEVILVKKTYPDRQRKRNWRLKRMAKEHNDMADEIARGGKVADSFERNQRDYEEFLRELEEDPELRAEVNLYAEGDGVLHESTAESDEDMPGINLHELKLADSDDSEHEEDLSQGE